MKRILYFTPYDPVHQYCGGSVRSAAMVTALQELGEVTAIVIHQNNSNVHVEGNVKYYPLFNAFRRSAGNPILRSALSLLDSSFLSREEILDYFGLPHAFDLVVVNQAQLAAKIAAWKLGPFCVDIDDAIPAWVRLSSSQVAMSRVKRWLVVLLRTMWLYRVVRKAAVCWVSNGFDVPQTRKHCNCFALPNIATGPSSDYEISESQRPYLLSVGNLVYPPNYWGIDKFLSEYWPVLIRQHPEMEFHIVGRMPSASSESPNEQKACKIVRQWGKVQGVRLLGFVDNLAMEYSHAIGTIAAVWIGGGTAIKVIEALKFGCKIFATKFAVRGLKDREICELAIDLFTTKESLASQLDGWFAAGAERRKRTRMEVLQRSKSLCDQTAFTNTVVTQIREHCNRMFEEK